MRPLPLKWRVSLVIAAAQAAAIAIVCVVTYIETKDLLYSQLNRSLSATARTAATVLEDHPGPSQDSQLRAVVGASPRKYSPFFGVYTGENHQLLSSADAHNRTRHIWTRLDKLAPPTADRNVYMDVGPEDDPCRVVWIKAQAPAGPVDILVGQSTLQIQGEIHELIVMLVITGVVATIASIIAVMFLVVWALRPIARTASRLLKVTARNVGSFAKESPPAPAELRPFVKSVEDMLRRLEESINQQRAFISDASHELRTPLALTKSTVQLALSRERSAAEYRDALDQLLADVRRMERLAEELLTLARIEETPVADDLGDVDLGLLLAGLAEVYLPLAADAGSRMECSVSPVTVRGDERQLRRLFENLIDNAIKHGPSGAVRLSLSADGDGWAEAIVHDDGGGIPPEMLPHLFDRFFRADRSRSHSTGGAGLGLAIARQIVLRHGGEISIQSQPGSGTDVKVRLPLRK